VIIDGDVLVDLLSQLAMDVEVGRVGDGDQLLLVFLADCVVLPTLLYNGHLLVYLRLLRLATHLIHLDDVVVIAESIGQAVCVHLVLVVGIFFVSGRWLARLLRFVSRFLTEG